MANTNVNDYVDAAIDDETLERRHVKNAGTIIAQFLQVRKGLTGRVRPESLDEAASTLAAAIWARGDI